MGKASSQWMRLDLNFYSDPKVRALSKRHGEGYVFRWLKVVCLAYREHGSLNVGDPMVRDWVEDEAGLRGKRLDASLEAFAEVGLIDAQAWREYGIVTSARMSDEAANIESRSSRGKDAARKRWAKGPGDVAADAGARCGGNA